MKIAAKASRSLEFQAGDALWTLGLLRGVKGDSPIFADTKIGTVPCHPVNRYSATERPRLRSQLFQLGQPCGNLLVVGNHTPLPVALELPLQIA